MVMKTTYPSHGMFVPSRPWEVSTLAVTAADTILSSTSGVGKAQVEALWERGRRIKKDIGVG